MFIYACIIPVPVGQVLLSLPFQESVPLRVPSSPSYFPSTDSVYTRAFSTFNLKNYITINLPFTYVSYNYKLGDAIFQS